VHVALPHRARAAGPALVAVLSLLTTGSAATVAATRPHPAAAAARTHHQSASISTQLATLALPAAPAPAGPPPNTDNMAAPVGSDLPAVPRPKHLIDATLLVTGPRSLTAAQVQAVRALYGVHHVQTVAAGNAQVDGHRAFLLGVSPASFRPWTPKLTAQSQPLWQSIAAGELTASFDMGHDAQLPLGATIAVKAAHDAPVRIGAFASVGMAGVDAIVSDARARDIGLPAASGVLVSAPHVDPAKLRVAVKQIVGKHARAWLLRETIVIRDAGEFMTRLQINTILRAAASRVGKPYVWGATGPDSFDCSGLVLWSFAHAGIRMPRVSQQQFFAGPHVPYSAARPGDLLFWHYDPTDPTDVDHVAIYAGNGMMIVAPHTGEYVEYVAVPLNRLAGVVRVDPAMAGQI
jgi:hypothetical protein